MKGAIITHPGLEAVPGKEIKELIGKDPKLKRSVALFETDNVEDFCTLCYRSQSAIKVLQLFFSSQPKRLDDVLPTIGDIDLKDWLKDKTFCVRCRIVDNDMFDTMESERLIGEVIHEKYKAKVSLEDPDVTFFAYVIEKDL
jgi:23S rRNA G2445 N2-methylase RlmL